MEQISRRALIKGRVQGVAFRACCADQARREGVAGYAKNLPDGTVEVLLEGSPEAVQKVISWCRQGPPTARVEHIEINTAIPGNHSGFAVL